MTRETRRYNGMKTDSPLNIVLGRLDICAKTMKPDYFYTPHTRINAKWIKHLKIKLETIKSQKKTQAVKYQTFLLTIFFSAVSPQARETKEKIKMGLYKTKTFLHSKRNHQQNEKTT